MVGMAADGEGSALLCDRDATSRAAVAEDGGDRLEAILVSSVSWPRSRPAIGAGPTALNHDARAAAVLRAGQHRGRAAVADPPLPVRVAMQDGAARRRRLGCELAAPSTPRRGAR